MTLLSRSLLGLALLASAMNTGLAADDARLSTLAKLAQDENPRVRVEAVRALAKIPSARSVELVLGVLDKPMDTFLDYAVWLSINDLAQPFLKALESGEWKPDTAAKQRQLEFAMKSIEPGLASAFLAKSTGSKPIPRNGGGPWIELLGQSGGPAELGRMFEQVLAGGFDDAASARVLKVLGSAARLRNVRPGGDTTRVGQLFAAADPEVRLQAVRLAGAWKNLGEHFPKLLALAGGADTAADLRAASFESLREIGGPGTIDGLKPLTGKTVAPGIRRSAAATLAALNPVEFSATAVAVLADTTNEAEATELWRALLNIKGAGKALAAQVPLGKLNETAAKAGLRVAREGGRKETELVAALTQSGQLAAPAADLTPAQIQAIAAAAATRGDAARGEKVYRRAELACMTCHSIGGVGGKVGPDMTSIGASAPADYLVESLFLPNAKIKEGYHSLVIETKDAQEFSGILVRESGQELVLRNAANQEVSVALKNIAKRANGLSLMPSGLLEALKESERLDLFKFLTLLGKPGDYDAGKGGVARLWQVAAAAHTDMQKDEAAWVSGKFPAKKTTPLISLVDGRLVADDLKATLAQIGFWESAVGVFVATQFQSPKEGAAAFKLEGGVAAGVFIDGRPVKVAKDGSFSANLPAGPHTLVLRLDAQALPASVRVKSGDVNFTAGL